MRNLKLENFKKSLKGKRIAVLGLGISNVPLVEFLHASGADRIECFDRAEAESLTNVFERLKNIHLKYHTGKDYLKGLKGFDIIFKTPVVRYDIPELCAARSEGALVTSEMEVFCDLCPAEIIAVTGSDGKTTTTTIIHGILKNSGYKCWLGGNIGTPLLSRIEEIGVDDKVVLELSSFQLHTMRQRINKAVITNISPNHLDVHKSYEEYKDAKKNIFRYQQKGDKVVFNADSDTFEELVKEKTKETRETKGTVLLAPLARRTVPLAALAALSETGIIAFSYKGSITGSRYGNALKEGLMEGAYIDNDDDGDECIYINRKGSPTKVMKTSSIVLPGTHNIENYMSAIAAVFDYTEPEIIRKYAEEFGGVHHRLERVRELNGVTFINGSIASSPNRTIADLKSFNKKVILIAGGKDKNNDYSFLGEYILRHVKQLYLIGQTSYKIKQSLDEAEKKHGCQGAVPTEICSTYEEMVQKAYKKAIPGDIILLSPASTSFDMFKNFEERGNLFKRLVLSL